MNRIYKVIWSKVKNCYIVVSEIAKSHSKPVSTKLNAGKTVAAVLAVTALCSGFTVGNVFAATATNPAGEGPGIAIGTNSSANNNAAVAVGMNAQANNRNSVAVGYGAQANYVNAIAVGTGAKAENSDAIAMGTNSSATGNLSVSIGQTAGASGAYAVALGQNAKANKDNSVAIGRNSSVNASNAVVIGFGASTTNEVEATATTAASGGTRGVALGNSAQVQVTDGVALGYNSIANRSGYVADTTDSDGNVTVKGNAGSPGWDPKTNANADSSLWNNRTWTANKGAVSIGRNGETRQIINVAAGTQDTDAVNVKQLKDAVSNVVIHANYTDTAATSIIGNNIGTLTQTAGAGAKRSVAIGRDAKVQTTADYGISIGNYTNVTAAGGVAVGNSAQVQVIDGVAIGSNAVANRNGYVADSTDSDGNPVKGNAGSPGWDPKTNANSTLTNGTWTANRGALSIGNGSNITRQITSVAAGTQDTDAVNVKQLKEAVSNVYIHANGDTVATSINGNNLGTLTQTGGAGAKRSVAIGRDAKVQTTADYGISIGNNTNVTAVNGVAIGNSAQAQVNDGVAIGSNAVANRSGYIADTKDSDGNVTVKGNAGSPGWDPKTNANSTLTTATWTANRGALSFGNGSGITRQITSVAAGTQDTDAVNVKQLKDAVSNVYIHANGDTVATSINGNNLGTLTQTGGAGAKRSVAIGRDAKVQTTADYGISIGNNTNVAAVNGIALGNTAKVDTDSQYGIAIGQNSTITKTVAATDTQSATGGYDGIAIGRNTNVQATGGISLGVNSIANRYGYVADTTDSDGNTVKGNAGSPGYDFATNTTRVLDNINATWRANNGALAIGNGGNQTRQIIGVAAGTQDTDAVNVAQIKGLATALRTQIAVKQADTTNALYGGSGVWVNKNSTNAIALGTGAFADTPSTIAIGDKASVASNASLIGGIAIGKNAYVLNGGGLQEAQLGFDPTNWPGGGWGGYETPTDPSRVATGIAIGVNSDARTGSIDIGGRAYIGTMGGKQISNKNAGGHVNQTTLGTNSYNKGLFSTMVGSYSITTGGFDGSGYSNSSRYAAQNFGATVIGSLNSVRSNENRWSGTSYQGIANTIVGLGNITDNTNGSLVFGAGNTITNSITDIYMPTSGANSVDAMVDKLQSTIKSSNSGGATLAIGGGNSANYTRTSSIIGVNNTMTGTSSNISQYNALTGYNNTGTNVTNVTVTGSNNTVSGSTSIVNLGNENAVEDSNNTILLGDNRTVTGSDNSIILGRANKAATTTLRAAADTTLTTTADNVVVMGYNANATVNDGVALGSNSVASVDKGVDGYNPSAKTLTGTAWTSTLGSVSVGDVSNNMTRQITGVAAGTQDTDAVNVAQLKANKVDLKEGDNVTITSTVADDGATTYTIKSTDTNTTLASGTVSYVGADGTLVLTDSAGEKVTVTGLKNTYLTGATLSGNTLTLTQNEGSPITVTGIATTADLATNKVKYFSVKSELTANQNNDGAKGTNSIAIGPNSVAQRENGIALGTNVYSGGKGSIVIGSDAKVSENIALEGSIVIGKGAVAFTGGGEQEALLGMDPTNWPKRGSGGYDNPTDASRVATSIVIGTNAFGRTGSIDIGDRVYKGTMGGKQITDNNTGFHVNQTTLGTNTYNKGLFSTMVGSYSIATGSFDGSGRANTGAYGAQNFGATVMGSLNSIRSNGSGSYFSPSYQGIANTIVGLGNITDNSNGSLVFGAGNKITNSITSISMPTSGADSVDDMVDKLQSAIKKSNSGGATLAIGGGNTADYTRTSSIIGVNNTLTGTSSNISQYNAITGYNNTATNVNNVTVTGVNNKVTNTKTAVVIGDNRTLTGVSNNVVIGSADSALETTVSDAVAVGRNTNVTIDGGVALGANSVARTDKGVVGYDPSGKITDADSILGSNTQYQSLLTEVSDAQTTVNDLTAQAASYQTAIDQIISMYPDNSYEQDAGYQGIKAALESTQAQLSTAQADLNTKQSALAEAGKALYTWQSTAGSVSVGDVSKGITRQITDVAAGTADTDAVNVAQLKQVAQVADDASKTTLKFTGDDKASEISRGNGDVLSIIGGATATDTDGNSLLTDSNIGVVKDGDSALKVQLAKDLTGLTSVRIGGTTSGGIYIAKQSINNTKGAAEEGNYVTGLTNKTWDPTNQGYVSGRAATEDQLNSVYENINKDIEASKVTSGKNITVGKDNKVSLNDNITLGGDTAANQVNINGNDAKVTAGDGANKVVVDGSKGQVTIGDAANGGIIMGNQTDVKGTKSDNTTDSQSGHFITGLDNTTWDPANKGIVEDRAATEGQLKDIADKISDIDTAVKSSSRVFESDSGADNQVTRKNTEAMKLNGGADVNNLSDKNIGVVNNSDGSGFDIKLSKDIKDLNSIEVNNKITIGTGDNQTVIEGDTINTGSVTTGNTTINNDGLTIVNEDSSKNITINNNNVNMGGNVIKNIGEGTDPTDAINKNQFDRAINNIGTGMNQINNRVNKLDTRISRVGAGAAALASLHPLEFSPEAKWEVTAGVGNYRGANAVALGAFYRPNGDTMVSIGTSYGGGENMVNAGVTWRVGEGETANYPSKQAMAQEIDSLKSVVADQSGQLQAQNSKIEAQSEQLEEQNKKIEQLMQAIAELKK